MIDGPLHGWLLAAAVAALAWWLHRRQRWQPPAVVAALFLWQRAAEQPGGRGPARRAAPAWLLRAAVCVALVLALSGVSWRDLTPPSVVVWFDDAPSMLAREQGVRRAELALQRLGGMVGERAAEVRFLGSPEHARPLRDIARLGPEPWPAQAAAAAPTLELRVDREHWLVTDGATPRVRLVSERHRFDQLVQVGAATENVAVVGLALRRALHAPRILGAVRVVNLGHRPAARTITVATGAGEILRQRLQLAPEAARTLSFGMPAAATAEAVAARLDPADALPEDDVLFADTGPLKPLGLRVGDACPMPLLEALTAHPGLRPAAAGTAADLAVECAMPPAPAGAAASAGWRPTGELLEWLGPDGATRYFPGPWRAMEVSAPAPGATVLVRDATNGAPLVLAAPGRIQVLADLNSRRMPPSIDYPDLVSAIVGAARPPALLDPVVSTERPADASRIAPRVLALRTAPGSAPAARSVDLTPALLALAMALVAADLVFHGLRRRYSVADHLRTAAEG